MKNSFENIWGRIKKETGLKSLKSLADIVEISQPAVSEMKAKGKFPAGWAYAVGKKYGLLTEWIMTGEGPKRLNGTVEINPLLIGVNEWLNEEKKENDAEFKILFQQQMIRAFFDYEKWIKKRDEQENSESISLNKKVA
ncbi:MAG: helix-turn-helix domain-containing protein [Chlorobium sp.]|nr:helix-turn-helix domain-containing protein [Chlorobium sp.]